MVVVTIVAILEVTTIGWLPLVFQMTLPTPLPVQGVTSFCKLLPSIVLWDQFI